jgi:hypothetical protein
MWALLPLTREGGEQVDVNLNHIMYSEPHGFGSILYLTNGEKITVQQGREQILALLPDDSRSIGQAA